MALVLDGVVLCLVPLGAPTDSCEHRNLTPAID